MERKLPTIKLSEEFKKFKTERNKKCLLPSLDLLRNKNKEAQGLNE